MNINAWTAVSVGIVTVVAGIGWQLFCQWRFASGQTEGAKGIWRMVMWVPICVIGMIILVTPFAITMVQVLTT